MKAITFLLFVGVVVAVDPIKKYVPIADFSKPLPYNVKCYDLYTQKGTKPSPGIDPGVYVFFNSRTSRATYVGKANKDIWERMTYHYINGYNKEPTLSNVCYVVTDPNFPPGQPYPPYLNYSPYIIESLMLATFCFDSNSVDNGGNGYDFLKKPSEDIPKYLANYKCDAGDGDVLERLSFFADNIPRIAAYLYGLRAVQAVA